MYDLILDIGCHCPCECTKPLTDIVNRMGFTPLTLAAKLARKEVNLLNSDNSSAVSHLLDYVLYMHSVCRLQCTSYCKTVSKRQ